MLEEALNNKGMEYLESLEREYRKATTSIEKDISVWYQRFATNNEISLAEAKKFLTNKELKEFRWTVEDYIQYGQENAINQKWMKELENASAKYHISRLDSLKLQLQQQVEVLFGNQLDSVDKHLRDIYTEGYYHTAFEIQKGVGLGWKLEGINSKQLDQALSKPWSTDASTFSDNIWRKKDKLVKTVQSELTQAIIRGDAPDKAIKTIANKLGYHPEKATVKERIYNAGRLVMTEQSHLQAESQKQCYKDLNVERFEVVGTLDGITCKTCGAMDGKVFKMTDYESGVTANPFHCWCRCCTAPYFDDMYGERIARDPKTGETYTVPGDMTYEAWKEKFVDSKVDLQDEKDNGIINNKGQAKTIETPEDLKALLGDSEREFLNSLSVDEKAEIADYTSAGAMRLNNYLRDPSKYTDVSAKNIKDEINMLDGVISRFNLKDPIKIFRAVKKSEAFPAVSDFTTLVGKKYTDPAYMSTTPLYSAVKEYSKDSGSDVIFEITLTPGKGKGAYINELSSFKDTEYEFLLKRGSEFSVVGVDEGEENTVIRMVLS